MREERGEGNEGGERGGERRGHYKDDAIPMESVLIAELMKCLVVGKKKVSTQDGVHENAGWVGVLCDEVGESERVMLK